MDDNQAWENRAAIFLGVTMAMAMGGIRTMTHLIARHGVILVGIGVIGSIGVTMFIYFICDWQRWNRRLAQRPEDEISTSEGFNDDNWDHDIAP